MVPSPVMATRCPSACSARMRASFISGVGTGRQALKLGLIDAIGGEAEARAWLAAEKSVPESLPARDLRPGGLRERVLGDGNESILSLVVKSLLSQRVSLDGAWAVWQPSATAE